MQLCSVNDLIMNITILAKALWSTTKETGYVHPNTSIEIKILTEKFKNYMEIVLKAQMPQIP